MALRSDIRTVVGTWSGPHATLGVAFAPCTDAGERVRAHLDTRHTVDTSEVGVSLPGWGDSQDA